MTKDWVVPGLYAFVYLDKVAEDFSIIRFIDLNRPHVVYPIYEGVIWKYFWRVLQNVNDLALRQIIELNLDEFSTVGGFFSPRVIISARKQDDPLAPLIEILHCRCNFAHSDDQSMEAWNLAGDQLRTLGFDTQKLYSHVIEVDFGPMGTHEYLLMGGPNIHVMRGLLYSQAKRPSLREKADTILQTMDEEWHNGLARYIREILMSKVKYSPHLSETLVDDRLDLVRIEGSPRKTIDKGIENIFSIAVSAYAKSQIE
jgi:hypothetical protein